MNSKSTSQLSQKKKNIGLFLKKLEEVTSQYSNFQIELPFTLENGAVSVECKINSDIVLPESVVDEFAMEPIHRILNIVKDRFNENNEIDPDILQNTPRDVSLSFIFNNYMELDKSEQYKYIKMVNELKKIGAKTYENEPVNIGILYCEEELNIEEIKLLDADIIPFHNRKTIQQFFLEEKPLLRLIDNQSLAVVVNQNFEVFALVRKKPNGKSLSYLLESQFNDWAIYEMNKALLQYFTEYLATLAREKSTTVYKRTEKAIENILEAYKKMKSKQPKYVYFSIRNKEVNVFTNQKFVISYTNGDWQLKHYNIMLGIITRSVIAFSLTKLAILDRPKIEKRLKELQTVSMKLYNIIKTISQRNSSSIFSIFFNDGYSNPLTSTDAKQLLEENKFKENNLNREFISIIKNDEHHLNVNDADQYLIEILAAIDGTVLLDRYLNIISFGEIITIPDSVVYTDTFGTGTKAARYASSFGIAIKISEDGDICIFEDEKLVLKI